MENTPEGKRLAQAIGICPFQVKTGRGGALAKIETPDMESIGEELDE